MKIHFYRPDGGDITVVSIDNKTLLIRADIPGTFIVSNPLSTTTFGDIHCIDTNIRMTPEQIFARIDEFYKAEFSK